MTQDSSIKQIVTTTYYSYIRRSQRDQSIQVFIVSLKVIEKALALKKKVNVMSLLLEAY